MLTKSPREIRSLRLRRIWPSSRVFTAFIFLLFTWIGQEFASPNTDANLWYGNRIAGVPAVYFVVALVLVVTAPAVLTKKRVDIILQLRRVKLFWWVVFALVAITTAVARAVSESVAEPFVDWRNFVVLAVVVAYVARWLAAQPWGLEAPLDLAVAIGLACYVPLALWVAGLSVHSTLGVPVPLYDGPTLQVTAWAALVTGGTWLAGPRFVSSATYARAVAFAGAGSSLAVLLSLRRSHWVMWVVGMTGLLILHYRRGGISRSRMMAGVTAVVLLGVVVAGVVGPDIVADRLDSFVPGRESRFSVTNEDHLGDVLDAIDVVRADPVFGFGIGKYYETTRITSWKEFSFETHNAVVNTWLKFGALGALAYLGFHFRWIERMISMRKEAGLAGVLFPAMGMFLLGEFVASLAGTSWYASFQATALRGLMLGSLVAYLQTRTRQRS